VPGDDWAEIAGPIGEHSPVAVREALADLVAEGLAEAHPRSPGRVRLPVA
jgi:predicted ArsR family transcriptional regulator